MFSILDTNMSQKHYLGMASGVLNQLPFNEIIKIIPEQHHLDDPFNLYFSTYHPDSSETALIIMQSSPIQNMYITLNAGLRHLFNLKLLTSRRNAVFFCQIFLNCMLCGVVFYVIIKYEDLV